MDQMLAQNKFLANTFLMHGQSHNHNGHYDSSMNVSFPGLVYNTIKGLQKSLSRLLKNIFESQMPRWDNSSFIFKIRIIKMMGHSFSNSLNTACPNHKNDGS